LQLEFSLLRVSDSAELVEKVGRSITVDSKISHKGPRCFRKHKLKNPKGKDNEQEEDQEGNFWVPPIQIFYGYRVGWG
jgi:hypothetical protein